MGGLGMRDIKDFNVALFAKQSWRLMKHPQSLLARLYKTKYYPKSSLLEAGTKWRSSHAWKSILQDNLKKRKLRIDNTCQRCGECPETVNHLLFQCKLSKEMWKLAPISAPPDGSWTFSTQQAGIGWTMYDKRAHLIVKGSAAVNPSASPLEVEIEALRMAIMQIKNLGYIRVTFFGDSAAIYESLEEKTSISHPSWWSNSAISTYLRDIF
ncbi:Ribonuclease H-like superfamily [Arabidopsis suecica]|uniref:Ribonuclease H-like superfamily n=1 Tax=Arabidopsis suecica TaxID=45249 RepID=A0A8T2CWW3_ARASU|nr:Ribonuclease H-like superfamily [Arabidopsis suecica]